MKITKKRFLDTYNENKPNWYVKFIFDNFSNKNEDNGLEIKEVLYLFLIVYFLVGFTGTVFNFPRKIIGISTIMYTIFLVVMVFGIYIGVFLNNRRIKKITKKLDIDINEYNKLANKYL